MIRKRLSLVLVFGMLAAFLLFMAPRVYAANQVVSDCGDNGGANQLRTKITEAQNSGGGTITFTCGPNVTLTGTVLPIITTNITINGGNTIILSGNSGSRIFYVGGAGTLTLNNLTVTKGLSTDDGGAIRNDGTLNINNSKFLENQSTGGSGGAIVSYGPLNITSSEFANNKAVNGGALYPRWSAAVTTIGRSNFHHNEATGSLGLGGAILAWDGSNVTIQDSTRFMDNTSQRGGALHAYWNSTLTVKDSTVNGNKAYRGGGIWVDAGSSVTVETSTVSGNQADLSGGGIHALGSATLTRLTISSNTALIGGGINLEGDEKDVVLTDTTVSENTASWKGGGIAFVCGVLKATNVTVSGNSAEVGGGIYAYSDCSVHPSILTSVTVSGNTADSGSGLFFHTAPFTLKNTILNNSSPGGNCVLFSSEGATPESAGFNLSSDTTCAFFLTRGTDYNNLTPLLGPLAYNGGYNNTHLPQPLSPVIDHGSCTDTDGNPVSTDQRNIVRPQGTTCDIGAVELEQAATPTRTRTRTPTGTPTRTATASVTLTNTPTRTVTNTPTRTPTKTVTNPSPNTPSATPTTGGCTAKPQRPTLQAPANNATVNTRPTLKWNAATCAETYTVVVKDMVTGKTADKKTYLTVLQYRTKALPKGKTYKWYIQACNAAFGCTKSAVQTFTVQ